MTDDPKGDAPKATAAKPATRRKPAAAKTTTGSASGSRTSRTKASASKTTAAAKPAAASAARKPAASKAASKPAATKTAATRASAAKGPAAKSATAKPATAKPAAVSKTIAPATASAANPATAKPADTKAAPTKPRAAKTAASKPAAQKTAAAKTATAAKASAAKTTPAKTPAKKPVTRKAPAKSAASKSWPVHGTITGPLVMIGLGSIGKGTLPLIERHFKFDKSRFTVIDPVDTDAKLVTDKGYKFQKVALTPENYEEVLTPLLSEGEGQGFVVNLSVDTSSLDLMKFCRNLGVLYIDTVVEPWPGFYFDDTAKAADRTNYALRETVRKEKKKNPGGTTAVSCCGANPGMVSWFVKQALVDIATDTGVKFDEPSSQKDWAKLMKKVGVKGIHIAERDTQRAKKPKPMDEFWNTWSVEGFLSEGFQPAELGWGTHETWKPKNAKEHKKGCRAAIYLEQPGASTRVRTWCPTPGPQYGFLVTHNEAISIADYFTLEGGKKLKYRPTCHYAYHPANVAVLSLHELFGSAGKIQEKLHVLDESEIQDGIDELGVLLYGHKKNAYWYGSQLSVEETRKLAPYQNATGLQVTSAVLAGMVWALENPEAGIVETDEMDYKRCLEIQKPYLGPVKGYYTDWTPLDGRPGFYPEDLDTSDPWQFKNILVR
ncbi:Homospermidine synthase [Roseibium alexandrii DFL-11]|uniref:Homospermidine synthase n=2 Tax=Roseibium alexandrii TaxID=388408 RepID=A0A5E8H6F8_ROSAD|nr:Homospermidine synthase [Roseibium alexandrii DFL-11]